ncbi:acyltransferase [Flavobacterium panacagri]|uniref:acyltransferase n=1 Tax=Flavobacterium panacagri TaxID=3034146 RepID=UPI0025A60CCB|nr:acyltransferase [Flavobacterium panacagri]
MDKVFSYFILYTNGVKFNKFKTNGIPKVYIALGGRIVIGTNFKMNNREISNPIGRFNKCSFMVGEKGELIIGNNVGMSSSAIVCHDSIRIGNNVNLGGNVVIYDTDFHSLNSEKRRNRYTDVKGTKTKPVIINNNVFIGAHSTILKGVTIGENSIVGACSVVTKNIPENQIWGGNPAKFIRELDDKE